MNVDVLKSQFNIAESEQELDSKAIAYRKMLDVSISYIYEADKVERPVKATMLELLDGKQVSSYVGDPEFIESLHFVRKLGMNAEHGRKIRKKDVKLAGQIMASFIGFLVDKESPDLHRSTIFYNTIKPAYMS